MMDELVHDLVSALEQTSEQNNLGHLWKEMVLSPLRRQRRQIRRRRDRKRRCNPSLHLLQLRRCLSEASESSLDEAAKDCRRSSTLAATSTNTTTNSAAASVAAANYSDSDDMVVTHRWHSFTREPVRSRQHSWPESDSFTENTPGRPLRRRRKVKRMTSEVMFRLQRTLKVSGVDGDSAFGHRSSSSASSKKKQQQQLSGMKKGVSGGWARANVKRQTEGVGLLTSECWKDEIRLEASEQRDASDESMSEGETSSICSSDPGLFTNDEGRQGDDEQSDWFFEGECGAGTASVAGLMPGWDSSDHTLGLEAERPASRRTFLQPARPPQRGFQARVNPQPGVSARCIRKGCRRILAKGNAMPMFVDRMKHLSQNPYQRDFRALSFGNRDRSQFNSLRSLPHVYPIDVVPENCHHRGCSSSVCRNRQSNVRLGLLCTRDVKRRRKTSALPTRMSADILFHREALGGEAVSTAPPPPPLPQQTGVPAGGAAMEECPAAHGPPDLLRPQTSSFDPRGDPLDN